MASFKNVDDEVVSSFGKEWSAFDQSGMSRSELREIFSKYFAIFPENALNQNAVGFDAGSGSGRWAAFVAPLVLATKR
jgi:hypothetical protein